MARDALSLVSLPVVLLCRFARIHYSRTTVGCIESLELASTLGLMVLRIEKIPIK